MKVQILELSELLDELAFEAERIRHNVVRVRIDRTPEQDEAISFEVGIWVTAVVNDMQNRADHLLEFMAYCGRDSRKGGDAGTSAANAIRDQVAALAASKGLTIRPGKLEFI